LYPQFILLGDSITQNSTVTLQAYLTTQYTRRFDVVNRGFSGYTAPLGLCAIQKFLPKPFAIPSQTVPQVKLLVLWYGANDACAPGGVGNQHVPLDEYVASLEAITRYPVLEAHKTAIVILTPPPVDEHQFDDINPRTAARTAQYAAASRELARGLGCPLVDVWKLFMEEAGCVVDSMSQQAALLGSKEVPPSSVFKELLWDGLHLSTRGYRLVFEEMMRVIQRDLPALAPENLPLTICEFLNFISLLADLCRLLTGCSPQWARLHL
jgi:lysophospholipase L1-like esterase